MKKRNVSVILLYDKNKRLLLQHRTDDAKYLPGCWALFGGGIDPGETPEQAVIRETKEELYYNLKKHKLVMVQEFKDEIVQGTKNVFMEEYDDSQELVLLEGKGMGWYHPDESQQLEMVEHDKKVLMFVKGKY